MGLSEQSEPPQYHDDGEKISTGSVNDGDQPAVELTDGRKPGEYLSRYCWQAWFQIVLEFLFLLGTLLVVSATLLAIGQMVAADPALQPHSEIWPFGWEYPRDRKFLMWVAVALSGVAGGTSFALKWLYHSVAKWTWNRDRILWRLIVPVLSGVFATFVAFMVSSEIVPFLNAKAFDNFYRALGGGFLLGYFSDNVLAALQNLAIRWFGTVDNKARGEQSGD